MKISARSSLHEIDGRGTGLSGYIEAAFWGEGLEKSAPVRMHLEVPVEKLYSRNAAQDREMHRLLGSRSFPNIVLDVNRVVAALKTYEFTIDGTVNVRGTTAPFNASAFLRQSEGRVHLFGERTIDIRSFGISPPRIFAFQVYPEVRVSVNLIAMLEE